MASFIALAQFSKIASLYCGFFPFFFFFFLQWFKTQGKYEIIHNVFAFCTLREFACGGCAGAQGKIDESGEGKIFLFRPSKLFRFSRWFFADALLFFLWNKFILQQAVAIIKNIIV